MTKLDPEVLEQIKQQVGAEVDARMARWSSEHRFTVVKARTAPLLTRLRYWWRRVWQAPSIAWAKRRYARMDQAARSKVDDAHLALVLRILRHETERTTGSAGGIEKGLSPYGKAIHRPVRGTMGPLDERVRNEDFVQFLLEGTEWQSHPKTAEDEDNLGSVEVKTPPKE
jgi:hypothetical protein